MGRADPHGTAYHDRDRDEAIAWFVRLRDPALTADERADFATWLAQSPDRAVAMAEVSDIWRGLEALPIASERLPGFSKQGGLTRRRLFAGLGLSTVAAAIGWGTWRRDDVSTLLGEQRLADFGAHASLELDSLSALDLEMRDPHPMAILRRGQVFVATDRPEGHAIGLQLPFGRVSAEVASFNLKLERHRALVSVESGTVLVERDLGGAEMLGPLRELAFGFETIDQPRIIPIYQVAPWRDGRLIFDRTLLVDVVDDLNRYRPGRVMIGDPRLDDLLVTGDFDIQRGDDALAAISHTFYLKSLHFGDALTVLFSA